MPLLLPKVRPRDVLLDRCYADPGLDAARDAVTDPSRHPDERATLLVSTVTARRGQPESQLLAQDVLAEVGHPLAEQVRALAGATADPLDRADALGAASALLVRAAWHVRGSGTADTVGPGAARTFHALLEEADDAGLEGLRLVADHPGCALARLVVARGRGVPGDEITHRFDVARAHDPLSFPAHLQMLQAVCRKWYGDHDSMFDLVRSTLAAAPPGHPVTVVLPVAHMEYLASGDRDATERRRGDLEHARRLGDALLAADDRHPRAPEAHSTFGWFFAATGDARRARTHLARVLHRPSWVWAYLDDDPARVYSTVLRETRTAR